MAPGTEVDEERLDPRSDDDDTNFEESEDELREEVGETLEKLATTKEEEKREEASGSSKDSEKSGERERRSMLKFEELNEGLEDISTPSNEQICIVDEDQGTSTTS
ncbi:serine/threonine-protein kinase Nek5-like [Microcebus murinus]|uniref:serine/threonine-protein kinase Nek5-like n=1 Tax=Microcebus murinus TaxID=30608 RepID=UPI003F6D5133